MKNTLTICTLIIALFDVRSACGQAAAYADADAYDVYSVVLASEWPVRAGKAQKLAIVTETTDYPYLGNGERICLEPPIGEEAVYKPLIDAHRKKNKGPWLLQPKFASSLSYQLISPASIDEIFTRKDADVWKEFYAKYPDSSGMISVSAATFNAKKTLALVYMEYWCGHLCGAGTYHFLRKINGKWAEFKWKGNMCSWIS